MRKAKELGKKELIEIVQEIQELLYLDGEDGEKCFWNPDKEWDVDFIESVAGYLREADLVPTVVDKIPASAKD